MADYISDDEARDRRLAAIRARRGTPERAAQIEALQAAKERTKKPASSGSRGARKTPENSDEFFGHPWAFWFAMRDAGYEHIAERARQRATTTTKELWDAVTAALGPEVGSAHLQSGHLLGAVSEIAHEKDGVLPTALVVERAGEPDPGPTFFRLAPVPEELAPAAGQPWNAMTDAQRSFWEEQRDLVFARFAAGPPT